MGQDTNRGRDFGRGPDVLPLDRDMRPEGGWARAEEAARRKKRALLEKQVREIEKRHGVGQLTFGVGVTVSDNQKERERRVVTDALGLRIDVHETVLAYHGLRSEPNPPVPDFDESEPF